MLGSPEALASGSVHYALEVEGRHREAEREAREARETADRAAREVGGVRGVLRDACRYLGDAIRGLSGGGRTEDEAPEFDGGGAREGEREAGRSL